MTDHKITEGHRALFRAKSRGRYALDRSHWASGVLYSSDGRIILCEPCAEGKPSDGEWPNPLGVLGAVGLPAAAACGPWSRERLPGPVDEPWQPHKANLLVKAAKDWWVESIVAWTINQLPELHWRVVPSGELKAIIFTAAGGAYGFTHAVRPNSFVTDSDFWKPEAGQ